MRRPSADILDLGGNCLLFLRYEAKAGERIEMNCACIAAFHDARRAARMLKNDGRHVLAGDSGLDALRLAVKARRLAHQKPSDIEHVNAKVEDGEMIDWAR